ncbi:hypothetical protein D3C80_1957150 [compost metagenome]
MLLVVALGHQHFSGHSYHLSERADLLGLARHADDADQLAIQAQWKVHPFLNASESASSCAVDFHSPIVGEDQLSPFVAGIEALSLPCPND